MKKGLSKLIIIIISTIAMLTNIPNLNAASGSITVKSSKSTVIIGSEFTITVTVSSKEALGTWTYTLNYDSSKVKLMSNSRIEAGFGDGTKKSQKYTYTFKSIAKGTSTISLTAVGGYAWRNNEDMSFSTTSAKITGITQAELEASYSKNNNLSSLGVEGYNLNEEFNKDTTEYTVTVPSDVEKIKLIGKTSDSKASVNGLGEFEVSEGENKFDIIVTAENGSQKTYTIKVNVQDNNPIEVLIDGLKYTVVKRGSTLTAPTTFETSTQMINGIEVPAFKSNITGFTLVGLKSIEGEPNLYIYNEEKNTYTLYKEIKTEGILLFPTTSTKYPDNYKKTTITINNEKVEAYLYDGIEDYYLVYGINIETGAEGFYQYDTVNNTITRYNDKIIKDLTEKNDNYFMIIIVLGIETIVMVLILLITLIKRNKTPKIKKVKLKDFEKELDKPTEAKEKIKEQPKKETKENEKKEEKPKEEPDNKENKKENKK